MVGYVKGFTHGLMVGMALGVLTAPAPGPETRDRLRRRAQGTVEMSRQVSRTVRQGWRSAQPVLDRAAQTASGMARVVQPVAQEAGGRFVELVGRGERNSAPTTGAGPGPNGVGGPD
ncbi:MAG: hypothetical protein ACREOD_03230 [Candidatus Dormibacteria bacterium]